MPKGLKFYPDDHRYLLDGEPVDSVTTILKNSIPKESLIKWAAKSVAEWVAANEPEVSDLYRSQPERMVARLKDVPFAKSAQAAFNGTHFHDLIERYLRGESIDVPDHMRGHFNAALQFIQDWKIEPVLIEAAIGSREHRYAGKFDLIADSQHSERAIFDWKTSGSGIYFETAFQLNAYAFAEFHGEDGDEQPMSDVGVRNAYAVHIRGDGYEVVPMKFGPDVFDEFVHLMNSARILARAEGNWRVPGSGYRGVGLNGNAQPLTRR